MKNNILRAYHLILLALIIGWLCWLIVENKGIEWDKRWSGLVLIACVYLCSHILRMLRLVLLTLDQREKAYQLISVHSLTAFPSSFLPFKLGEFLRLTGFIHVYNSPRKAVAVWLAERFGDVLIIIILILGLYLFNINIPPEMRAVFVVFVLAVGVSLFSLFAIAKVFIYLNRHFVLSSLTSRSLRILKISHAIHRLEESIYKSLEGRISAFLLLSALIWIFEILALSLFIKQVDIEKPDFAALFASGLIASLPGGDSHFFGVYQSLALVTLTIAFLLVAWVIRRIKITEI